MAAAGAGLVDRLGRVVLLLMVCRSVLVPIKAAVMNLVSVGAAYGVLVMVSQSGWRPT